MCEDRAAASLSLAQFHQLSLSLRPGGQRTGVPCVQFLSASQIIANEPDAPFAICLITEKAPASSSAGMKRRGRPKKEKKEEKTSQESSDEEEEEEDEDQ
ncbi:high mobility group AT-hook 1a isoform X2 [Osmerus eperlanus]|uniref:high mobility group AT-hook 1a isoform X2 n=1 Tax=Osmerus eperlanus TaxID=29151 RepID=UPI002E14AEA1